MLTRGERRKRFTVGLAPMCALVLLAMAGCVRARAANAVTAPPLEVPQPPARAVLPPEEPLQAEASVPEAPVPAVTAAAPRATPPRRAGGPPVEEPRPEPAPAAAISQTPDPSRELRAASSAADTQAERLVRDTLARSMRDLGRVNVSRLSSDGRAQFEQARRFSQQAEQALRSRNFIFATTLADKAAALAASLVDR